MKWHEKTHTKITPSKRERKKEQKEQKEKKVFKPEN